MKLHEFTSPASAADALARQVAADLALAIRNRQHAVLAVSGGRSPVAFFEALSAEPLDWSRVTVTLVDERLVPDSHADSNAALVRKHLLQGNAADAVFLPLVVSAEDAQTVLAQASTKWQTPDVVILGMGDDGHTASLFPAAANLAQGLAPQNPDALIAIVPPAAPHTRISMTLAELLRSGKLYLAIAGNSKRRVLDEALQGIDDQQPVSHVLAAADVHVYLAG